ncbi:hypothetical protein T459_23682 [Capsicum annuum]|uniref:Bromo domain-containing protein n=1 Tax=Capsicum annuum TaxID=4072 RepID=A0A2G2YT00_CAPAN|nr:hypothetical protein T459_23682 [Capsicum annuum]
MISGMRKWIAVINGLLIVCALGSILKDLNVFSFSQDTSRKEVLYKDLKVTKILDNLQELGSSTIFESNSIFSNLVDKEIPVKKANSLSSIDLVARNLLLLAHDPMENSDFVEEKITREDDNLKKDREFILPPNNKGKKDEDEQPLIWKVRKLKDNKGKEKFIGSNMWKKGQCNKDQSEGPPSCTRAFIKRKFHQVSNKHEGAVAKDKGSENSSKCNSKPTKLPKKRILELILDMLQRRDTHEIFAEPVDPTEVEDYYEIIKDPMDFGTMRAKLHEGMYQNLQQFEHDAFLIPKNAMHFNASGTVYFRQARAIYELAKKVFHVLKTNPGNFEVEFPVTRRRSMRRLQNEARDTRHSQGVLSDGAIDVSSKNIGLGSSVPSTHRRSSKERPPLFTKGPVDSAFLFGSRHGQTLSSLDAGRRSTYKICRPSPFRFAAFATVQSQSNTEVLTSSQKLSSPVRGFGSLLKSTGDEIDVTHTAKEDETCKIAGMSSQKSPLPHPENSETKSTSILCYKRNIHKVTEEGGKKTQNRSEGRENNLASHISTNGTSGDTKNIGSSSNQSFFEPKSKYSELKLNKAIPVVPFQARASSRFIFDMPFLQAQLNQMNPAGKNDMPLVSRDNMERSLY